MGESDEFAGFPPECINFYEDLTKNNSKQWFEKNRGNYEKFVLDPSRKFVMAMGEALSRLSPAIRAEPRVDRSIFRIHRDIRFSKDKRPYKTHLALWFWEGAGPRMECSGYYFHLEPGMLMVGTGIYIFPKHLLKEYRDSVVHKRHGKTLMQAIEKVRKKGYEPAGRNYKKTPRGYEPDHENAEMLLYNGLYTGAEGAIPKELFSPDIINYCLKRYRDMYPIHEWLNAMTERAGK